MGLEFIRRAAASFEKAWNRGRNLLAEPSLFTHAPQCQTRTVVAIFDSGKPPEVGAKILVQQLGSRLVLSLDAIQLGAIDNPPADILDAISSSGGVALGTVERFHELSGTADLKIN